MQITALSNIVYRAAGNRPLELSSAAAVRLKLLEQWRAIRAEGATAARAADILHVPRANLYRWQARLDKRGLRGLEPGSRRPRNSRKPQRDPALVKAVLDLRKKPPCYGKDKTAVELRKDGWAVSASMAGRILSDAKRRGTLREPPRPGVARRNPKPKRPYAVRKPKDYRPARPGDLVQVDTSTSARSPAWSSSISRRGTSSPAAMSCRWGRKRPPRASRGSSTPSLRACPSRSGLSRWTAAPSSRGRSRRPAVSAASCSSCSRPIRRS